MDDESTQATLFRTLDQWAEEDECFRLVARYALAWDHGLADMAHEGWAEMKDHSAKCGGCIQNVLETAETTTDKLRKSIYGHIKQRAMLAFLAMGGGSAETKETEQGQLFRWRNPPNAQMPYETPYTGGELLTAKGNSSYVIFDAATKEIFEDSRRLLQHLDVTATREVQRFDFGTTPALHWRTLLSNRPVRLMVRWEGQVRVLAEGHTLVDRYRKRLKVSLDAGEPRAATERSDGDDTDRLRGLALKYDETKAWFAGFADHMLKFREIDQHRHEQLDATAHVERAQPKPDKPDVEDSIEQVEDPTDEIERVEQRHDAKILVSRIEALLSPRELEVARLKAKGLKDHEVAERLGIARETVNRDLRKIRERAKDLLP